MFDFEHALKSLPKEPGVYLMKNNLGEVIYVGKAKILRNRVRQYFQNSKNHSEKVKAMVKNISEFEYIVTDSEMEALILECNLIKKYSPRYNILLKDDKTYPFIKITTNEDFPKVFVTRNHAKDGHKYFGPYTDAGAVYETVDLIKKLYPLRTCRKVIKEGQANDRPCLNYYLNICSAPCDGRISKEEYSHYIDNIISILSGKDNDIINDLKKKMEIYSENLEFEKAADMRDKINSINTIVQRQKMFTSKEDDEDYINMYNDDIDVCVQVFFVRNGKVSGREHYIIEGRAKDDKCEIIDEFLLSFYGGTAVIPKNIYVPCTSDESLIQDFLTVRRGNKVFLKIPQKGEKKDMMEMVYKNAEITMTNFKNKILKEKQSNMESLKQIADLMQLEDIPLRIESYDISNIQGVDSVGSMIVFENGKPKNSDYRRFKIKTVKGANDYDSMREILSRRFKRGLDEIKAISERSLELSKGKFSFFPDLIMMDGGKGQVNVALDVLKELNIDIPVCGLVKDDKHNTRGIIYENKEIIINKTSDVMHMITRIQDEVHRFAITYHRSLRNKRTLHSILEDIPNVGEKRRRNLLMKFGSIDNIKVASLEELMETPSIDRKSAESILDYFTDKSCK